MMPAETPRVRNYLLAFAFLATVAAMVWVARHRPQCPPAAPPAHYQAWDVVEGQTYGGSYTVRLADPARTQWLLMYVGASEGLAISLRLHGERYQRPLSMDLMDEALGKLGAEIERVQIDAIRDDAYIGSLHLRQAGREVVLDARPSDAVVLALAHHLPVLVADSVIARAGRPY
jgi:bifunctional DNase/RNase